MGHKSFRWNISSEKGIEIAHEKIIEILREKRSPTLLNELVSLLNLRTKNYTIHQNKKHNCFSKYLKFAHGGILKFLDDYNIYGIIKKSNRIHVVLLEDCLEENTLSPLKRITRDNEWIFV